MHEEIDPRNLPLDDLAHQCEQETDLYFKRQSHDTRYCYEMFRRAIQDRDSDVWTRIYNCYRVLVSSWVTKHPGFERCGEEVDYFVNGAFAKLSASLTSEKFKGFTNLESVLRYFKMCVFSVVVDYLRWAEQTQLDTLDADLNKELTEPSPEEQVIENTNQRALWDHLNELVRDEKERWMLRGMFVLQLKPQALVAYVPHIFQDVDEVYRVKQNVIARLRRDSEFQKLFGDDD